MDIFTKLRLLREAVEEAYSIEEGKTKLEELMDILEVDKSSISFFLGTWIGEVFEKVSSLQKDKEDDIEQEDDPRRCRDLANYYNAQIEDWHKVNHAIVAFMTAICSVKELD